MGNGTGTKKKKEIAHIRKDLKFRVEVEELKVHQISYNIHDLLVRVERGDGDDQEVRYGILVDLEAEGALLHDTYILEIPTKETDPKKIQAAQEKLIKQYVDEMRGRWKAYLAKATDSNGLLIDQYDRLQRFAKSTDGRWQMVRAFRTGKVPPDPGKSQFADQKDRKKNLYKDFLAWLRQKTPKGENPKAADDKKTFVHYRMPFKVGETYRIFVDWTIPYICFKEGWRVSHFKSDGGSPQLFYPFHFFKWQKVGTGKELKVSPKDQYGSGGGATVSLPPTNYAYLAYWTFVIEEIDRLQKENLTALRPYMIYLSNLSHIQALMTRDGPLKGLSGEEIVKLGKQAEAKWDGSVSDKWWKEHKSHVALGYMDLIEIKNMFAALIGQEAKSGRNANRATRISYYCHILSRAFSSKLTKELHEDLWAHNRDEFGTDLYLLKALGLLAHSKDGEAVYGSFVKKNVYEHSALTKAKSAASVWPDVIEWENMAYRSGSMLTEIWGAFYSIREKKALRELTDEIAKGTLYADEVLKWFKQSVPGFDPNVKISWKLKDEGVRNLVNFLIGGKQTGDVRKLEAKITVGVKQILGAAARDRMPSPAEAAKIREIARKAKLDFMTEVDPRIGKPGIKGPVITTAINFLIAGATFYSLKDSKPDSVATLRAWTVALGAGIDLVETVAMMRGIDATINTAVAARAGSAVVARSALGVGWLKAVGGGVGGALGVGWSAYDAYCGFSAGRSKDGLLDTISAVGCAITLVGLYLDSSVVGLLPGIICNVVGIAMVLIAQAVKYFRAWSGKTEDKVKKLYTNTLEEGGMDRMRHWIEEYAGRTDKTKKPPIVPCVPPVSEAPHKTFEDLTKRVHSFLQDWDTFDMFN